MNEFKMVVERFEDGQKKMAESIGYVIKRLDSVQEQVGNLTEGQMRLETKVTALQVGQENLEAGQARLEAGQARLEGRVDNLEAGQARLEAGQARLEGRVDNLEAGQARLEAGQNEIKAELKNKAGVELVAQLARRVKKLEPKAA